MKIDTPLEKFGNILITQVRDQAITQYDKTVAGKMISDISPTLSKDLSNFTEEQLLLIRKLIVGSIDSVIYNFLWMLEDNEDEIELIYSDETKKININQLSDGLSGEIFTEDGWIAKYSKYKENY